MLANSSAFLLTRSVSTLQNYTLSVVLQGKMQGAFRALLSNGNNAVLQHVRLGSQFLRPIVSVRFESATPGRIDEHGFERTTISDVLKEKGEGADGSWLWCTTNDSVYDAVKSVCILYLPLCFKF